MDKIEHNLEVIPPPALHFQQRLKDAVKMFLTFPIFKYKHIDVFWYYKTDKRESNIFKGWNTLC